MVHKTKYLVLQQSSAFPEFLLEYAKGGGDKDKVVVLNWPYVSCIFNIVGSNQPHSSALKIVRGRMPLVPAVVSIAKLDRPVLRPGHNVVTFLFSVGHKAKVVSMDDSCSILRASVLLCSSGIVLFLQPYVDIFDKRLLKTEVNGRY